MFDKLSNNLNELITTRNTSVIQLSRATGVPASTIKKIRNSSNMNPTLATLIPIARFFSVSLDYLIFGYEKKQKKEITDSSPALSTVQSYKEWPLISWEKTIYWPCADNSYQQKVSSMQDYNSQTFAVRVDADDWGIFTRDTILIIDPSLIPNHRDYVIVFKEGQSRATLKLFLSEDENKYLQSICIAEDVVPLTASYKILGVVMEYWKQLKQANNVCKLNGSRIEKK